MVRDHDREAPKGLKRGQEINVTDGDVFKMKGKELDDYLDWYQRTWVDDSDPKSKSFKYDQLDCLFIGIRDSC